VPRVACGYTLQETSLRLETGQKFLRGPWNLYNFVRLATKRGDQVGFFGPTLSQQS
jgi:hypothetical protein